jgi:hypothetical protein
MPSVIREEIDAPGTFAVEAHCPFCQADHGFGWSVKSDPNEAVRYSERCYGPPYPPAMTNGFYVKLDDKGRELMMKMRAMRTDILK